MVNRVFTDRNPGLVSLSKHFVCIKLCETDHGADYYRAAGYFLPQWYWQPILAVTYPDGREMNPRWRHTHEVLDPKVLAGILEQALEKSGEGLSKRVVLEARRIRGTVEEALDAADLDKAGELARALLDMVLSRGRLAQDARRFVNEIEFLRSVAVCRKELEAIPSDSPAWESMNNALNLATFREYAEALMELEATRTASGGLQDLSASFRAKLTGLVAASVTLERVGRGRFRFGPDIFHDIRAELRCTLPSVERLTVQYYVLDESGRAWARYETHGTVERGDHHRLSVFLPYADIPEPEGIRDIRVELWVGSNRVAARHLGGPASVREWWTRDAYAPLTASSRGWSTWRSATMPVLAESGLRVAKEAVPLPTTKITDPVHDEIVEIYHYFDDRRFSWESTAARYRLQALGTRSLPYIAPLAYRHGAITTLQLLPVLARIPNERAADRVIHNLGADDITVRYPSLRYMEWLHGQPYVDVSELVGYLDRNDTRLRHLALQGLGAIGKTEAFEPVLAHLRKVAEDPGESRFALEALRRISGRRFGLKPAQDLALQGEPVRKLHAWRTRMKDSPRAVWMTDALGVASPAPGQLPAMEDIEGAVKKALVSGDRDAERCALILMMDLDLPGALQAARGRWLAMGSRHPNFALVRNVYRKTLDVAGLGALIAGLEVRSRSVQVLDLLLTVTGQYNLYPEGGPRMSRFDGSAEMARWERWFGENKDRLLWDETEQMFRSRS